MQVHYKIIKKNLVGETNIIVRYYTDTVTEDYLCIERDSSTNEILRCRTDMLINVPIVPMTQQELETLIKNSCPWTWFEDEEKRLTATNNTVVEDLQSVNTLITNLTDSTLTFTGIPSTNTEWQAHKKKLIADKRDFLITNGGFKLISGGVTYWFHSNVISTCQQLGLISAAIIAKMQGAQDSTILHPVPWKTLGGSTVVLTVGIALSFLQASFAQQGALFAAAEAHKAAIDLSTDAKNYDINLNWPEVYQV